MPHYADGTEAKAGDLVRGRGYNVTGPDGKPAVIVGEVLRVKPGQASCNLEVAHVVVTPLPDDFMPADYKLYVPKHLIHTSYSDDGKVQSGRVCVLNVEYGQADHFTKIG